MYRKIMDKYGAEYLLRQLAEECCELSQAALKLIRAERRETPMRADEAVEHLMEEIADVKVAIAAIEEAVLTADQLAGVCELAQRKNERWFRRMIDGEMEEEVW